MAVLLTLFALLQSPPVVERSGLLDYKRPADWRSETIADGTRFLRAPGDGTEVVRFLAPEAWAGTPEAYHEALLTALRQGAAILSGGKSSPFGAFLRSEAVVGVPGQPQLWMALYTAKVGDQFQGVIYASPTAAGFARHKAAADGIVRTIELPAKRERVSGFELTLPAGWQREDNAAQGTTALSPRGLAPGATCGLVVLPARESPATAEEHHDQMWASLTASATLIGKPTRSELGFFRSSRAALQTAQGKAWLILYTTRRGGAAETIFFAAATQAHYDKHGAEADRLVADIKFPGAASGAAPAPPWKPTPIPPAGQRVKISGLWVNASTQLRQGIDLNGFGTAMRTRFEMLALWENGLVYRGIVDASPTTAPLGIVEGLAAVDAAKLATQSSFADGRFGRSTRTAGGFETSGLEAGDLTLTRDGAGFVAQDGGKWSPRAPVDGLTLEGEYVCAAIPSRPEMRITFHKDGKFEALNLNETVGSPTSNPHFPAQGKGTYEFQSWSLVLRFDGGFTQAIAFVTGGDALAGARSMVISGSEFIRQ